MKIEHFSALLGFRTKLLNPDQPHFAAYYCLSGLLSTAKILGKFVPQFFYLVSIDERPAMGSQPNLV